MEVPRSPGGNALRAAAERAAEASDIAQAVAEAERVAAFIARVAAEADCARVAPRVFGSVWEHENADYAQVAHAGCPRRAPNTRELAEGVLLRRDASQQDISFTRGIYLV